MSHYRLGAAILSASLIAGGLYLYQPPTSPPPKPATQSAEKITESESARGAGLIDIEQIKAKHPDGELLEELKGRKARLKLELEEVLRPVIPPAIPQIDEKPFEDSARERLMQDFISQMADLKSKQISLIEKYRQETEGEYIKRRNAVRDIYFNEALNITLKLQNADNLRLSKEEYEKLQNRLDEIVMERNVKQGEMREQWINEVTTKVQEEISEEQNRIKSEYDAIYQKSKEESEKRIREVEARNQALADAAREMDYIKSRRQELFSELVSTDKQIVELENKILDAVVSEVARLATIAKLEYVFVKDDENFDAEEYMLPPNLGTNPNVRIFSKTVVYSAGGITDLTKDLIKSMQLKGMLGSD